MSTSQCDTYQKLCNGVANQSKLVESMKDAVELERRESAAYRAAMVAANFEHAAAIAAKASAIAALVLQPGNLLLKAAVAAAGEGLERAADKLDKATADVDTAEKSLKDAESNLAGSERELNSRIQERADHLRSCAICSTDKLLHEGWREESSGWIVANDQSDSPTGIYYSIITAYEDNELYAYGLSLYNGYDRPVAFGYKVYFATVSPSDFRQYLYTHKTLDWMGFGWSEPVKVEIVTIEYR